jgi:hypothetical protein
MKPLALEDLLDLETYEALRAEFLERIIELKRDRRLGVGDRVTLVFENRETIRFQVQEMLRAERIVEASGIQDELDVYNELIPAERELSATLMVEITDRDSIKAELDRLIGLDEHVFLILGREEDEESIQASFDVKQFEQDRISAVQYLKFPLEAAQIERVRSESVPLRVRIDHPHYERESTVGAALRSSLLEDLERDSEPLRRLPATGRRRPA